jgi:hypothetical protein
MPLHYDNLPRIYSGAGMPINDRVIDIIRVPGRVSGGFERPNRMSCAGSPLGPHTFVHRDWLWMHDNSSP